LITKTDLAKAMNAWSQRPEIVSLGGQKNFVAFMRSIEDQVQTSELSEDEYKGTVGRVILMREATKLVREFGDRIPAWRANVVAYLISYLSFRMPQGLDFVKVWEQQAVPPSLVAMMRAWAEDIYGAIIVSAEGRNVGEWCKKPGCWDAIRALRLDGTDALEKYASEGGVGRRGEIDSDDAAAISECRRLTVQEWDAVTDWATRKRDLHYRQKGIVQTLRSYARDGWSKLPSPKQARAAAKVIALWRLEAAH
jgi:hypothetical protein